MSVAARLRSFLEVASSLALIVAAGVLVWTLLLEERSGPGQAPQVERVQDLRIESARITNQAGDARIAIVEFSDFQCPFCRKHAVETLPAIRKELLEPGKARYVAVHYPIESIHPHALQAAVAAECAGKQNRFWDMHERLFAGPQNLSRSDLIEHAQQLGLESALFSTCLGDAVIERKVRDDQAEGARLGVTGTPVFFVGLVRRDGSIDLLTRIRGVASVSVFAAAVEEAASAAQRSS